MTTKREAVEKAARAVLVAAACKRVFGDDDTPILRALDAALSLPPDPVPTPTERDRALVDAARQSGQPIGYTPPERVAEWIDTVIAAVDRTHPRPAVPETLVAWAMRFYTAMRGYQNEAGGEQSNATEYVLARVGPPPVAEAGVAAAIVALLRESAAAGRLLAKPREVEDARTREARIAQEWISKALDQAADRIEREHPDARALLLRVADEVYVVGFEAGASDDETTKPGTIEAIVDRALGGGR